MNTGGCPGLLCTPPNTRVHSALSFQGGKVAFETPLSSVCSFFTSTECTGVTLVNATVRLPRAQLCNSPSIPCSALATRPAPGLPAAKSPTPLPSPPPATTAHRCLRPDLSPPTRLAQRGAAHVWSAPAGRQAAQGRTETPKSTRLVLVPRRKWTDLTPTRTPSGSSGHPGSGGAPGHSLLCLAEDSVHGRVTTWGRDTRRLDTSPGLLKPALPETGGSQGSGVGSVAPEGPPAVMAARRPTPPP